MASLTTSMRLHMSFKLALLREGPWSGTTPPCAAKPIGALLKVLDMVTLAVILEFFVACELLATCYAIQAEPTA